MLLLVGNATGQIPGPGAERDYARIQEMKRGSVLQKDSVVIRDTVMIYDPESLDETMTIVTTVYSIHEYCQQILGVNNPNDLLDGREMKIANPETYEPMTIRWNASAGKIDTIQ
jgi:hypothetical protein